MTHEHRQFLLSGRKMGPGQQLLAVVAGAVVIVSALVLGFLILAALLGVFLVAWIIFAIRRWWQFGGAVSSDGDRPGGSDTLEGEFEVVDKEPGVRASDTELRRGDKH